jgi:hypothetical protein
MAASAWAGAPAKKPVPRHTLSGTITGLAPAHHTVVRANKHSSKETHTSSTRADGAYTLRGLTPGSYTVRPSHPRYTFFPSFASVVVRDSDRVEINFQAKPLPPRKR